MGKHGGGFGIVVYYYYYSVAYACDGHHFRGQHNFLSLASMKNHLQSIALDQQIILRTPQ